MWTSPGCLRNPRALFCADRLQGTRVSGDEWESSIYTDNPKQAFALTQTLFTTSFLAVCTVGVVFLLCVVMCCLWTIQGERDSTPPVVRDQRSLIMSAPKLPHQTYANQQTDRITTLDSAGLTAEVRIPNDACASNAQNRRGGSPLHPRLTRHKQEMTGTYCPC